jgi:hypothetical protein
MGFFKDKAAETQAAVSSGNTERAADIVVHAMLEGGTDLGSALAKLTDELNRQQGR